MLAGTDRSLPSAPPASSPTARKVMQGNRSDSRVEQRVRSALHRRGLRFRKHVNVVDGVRCRPDIVFTRARVAVFIDGCFWHSCPVHGTQSKSNAAWWREKLESNVARDRRNDRVLIEGGWTVLRFWEHEPPDLVAERVQAAVAKRGAARQRS